MVTNIEICWFAFQDHPGVWGVVRCRGVLWCFAQSWGRELLFSKRKAGGRAGWNWWSCSWLILLHPSTNVPNFGRQPNTSATPMVEVSQQKRRLHLNINIRFPVWQAPFCSRAESTFGSELSTLGWQHGLAGLKWFCTLALLGYFWP